MSAAHRNTDWVQLLTWAVGAYVLYRVSKFGMEKLDVAADAIADSIIKATLPGSVNVKGAAILPNGQSVSMNLITLGNDFTFAYNGRRYKLSARNAAGNYPATLVQ